MTVVLQLTVPKQKRYCVRLPKLIPPLRSATYQHSRPVVALTGVAPPSGECPGVDYLVVVGGPGGEAVRARTWAGSGDW